MTVNAYPVLGKQKSIDICKDFLLGCKEPGQLVLGGTDLLEGDSFFYGVDSSNLHFWRQARMRRHGGSFYYCDNSYFDSARQEFFRVTKNALQHSGRGYSDGRRFAGLGIEIKPWHADGKHIVICPQSDFFMREIAGYAGNWCDDMIHRLSHISPRPLRIRMWSPDKGKLASTLPQDLEHAHCLITWSSAAAISALLTGVPVFCDQQCAAFPLSSSIDGDFERPRHPENRLDWASVLADNQWTRMEMRVGRTWNDLHA